MNTYWRMYWKITTSLRLCRYQMDGLSMLLETTYCISTNKTKQDRFPPNKTFLCVRACMCLSGPCPVASQMGVCEEDYDCKPALPTHTVSKTYIHKTHFPRHPTPIIRSVRQGFEILKFYLEHKRQNNIFGDSDSVVQIGLKWSMCTLSVSF